MSTHGSLALRKLHCHSGLSGLSLKAQSSSYCQVFLGALWPLWHLYAHHVLTVSSWHVVTCTVLYLKKNRLQLERFPARQPHSSLRPTRTETPIRIIRSSRFSPTELQQLTMQAFRCMHSLNLCNQTHAEFPDMPTKGCAAR